MIRLIRYNEATDSVEPIEVQIPQPDDDAADGSLTEPDDAPSIDSYRQTVEPAWRARFDELASRLAPFCRAHLNADYLHLCLKLAATICHDDTPAGRGKPAGWAAGIVHAIGQVNDLNVPGAQPHMNLTDIGPHFGVSKATSGKRGREILDGVGITPVSREWLIDEPPSSAAAGGDPVMAAIFGLIEMKAAGLDPRTGGKAPWPVWRSGRPKCTAMLQLRVDLRHAKPPIWRRIEAPDSISLVELHHLLQVAFRWQDYHLHAFETADGWRFELPELADEFGLGPPPIDEWAVYLCDLIDQLDAGLDYTYDFGDDWEHRIKLEKTTPVTGRKTPRPRCLAGRRAAPPEDCGGMWGYARLLDVLGNPDDEEHEHLMEWIGGSWDAEAFDAEAIDREFKRTWRG